MTVAWPVFGHNDAEALFLSALDQDKLHHAWIIEGPMGIGKARVANRLSAFLLGARADGDNRLDAHADDPVMQKLLSASHPDFRLIERVLNDRGKLKQDISVSQIRSLTDFFTLKPAMGGWRVGVIDALDELNVNGANALLKTLEEPPARSILFLINHGTQALLPTIRSRCRVLRLKALSDEDTAQALKLANAPREASSLARGRPGLGMRLASPAGISAAETTRALLRAMPKPRDSVVASAHRAASVDPIAMEAFREEVLGWLADAAPSNLQAADAWLEMSRLFGEAGDLNMEPAQVASKVIASLHAISTAH